MIMSIMFTFDDVNKNQRNKNIFQRKLSSNNFESTTNKKMSFSYRL